MSIEEMHDDYYIETSWIH